jgi:hypothetical protein
MVLPAFKAFGLKHALPPLAAVVLSSLAWSARAAEPLSFTVPAEDGYGIGDCMHAGSECGRVMANSWCEAHGHVKAVAFGLADDVTGAIPVGAKGTQAAAGDVLIRCGD